MSQTNYGYLETSAYYLPKSHCFLGYFDVNEEHINILRIHFETTGENLIDSYVEVIHASMQVKNKKYFFKEDEMTEMLSHLWKIRRLKFLDAHVYSNAFFALITARNNLEAFKKHLDSEPRREADRFLGNKDVRKSVFDKYGKICLCCGTDNDMSLDHVIPVIRGGENNINNLQPLCKSCNSKKGTKIIDYRHG